MSYNFGLEFYCLRRMNVRLESMMKAKDRDSMYERRYVGSFDVRLYVGTAAGCEQGYPDSNVVPYGNRLEFCEKILQLLLQIIEKRVSTSPDLTRGVMISKERDLRVQW